MDETLTSDVKVKSPGRVAWGKKLAKRNQETKKKKREKSLKIDEQPAKSRNYIFISSASLIVGVVGLGLYYYKEYHKPIIVSKPVENVVKPIPTSNLVEMI